MTRDTDNSSSNFNSHTREGVTPQIAGNSTVDIDFNSHTREGVTNKLFICEECGAFQLTHP